MIQKELHHFGVVVPCRLPFGAFFLPPSDVHHFGTTDLVMPYVYIYISTGV